MGVSEGIDPHITYGMSYLEWDAAVTASLDLWKWDSELYPRWFKAKVIAFYNLRNLVEMHKQDAISKDIRRKQKTKKK